MNKISVVSAMVSDVRIRETTPIPARSAISPLELTPLPTPGSTREPTSAGATGASPTELPAGRHAVFDRAFEDLQLRLAERRRAGTESYLGTSSELGVADHRDCDTALQWISACLRSAGES
ncbi:MAG: hypothetical protein RL618_1773 [Pseudomonadota bacterium]|jgi:hypothetical protein